MEKGRNRIKGSGFFKQWQSCLSSVQSRSRAGPGSQGRVCRGQQGRTGTGGQDGDRRAGQTCWAPPASGEGRLAQGMLGVKCPPPAFCTVCGFFTCFYPFKLHLYDKPPGCERISLGKN